MIIILDSLIFFFRKLFFLLSIKYTNPVLIYFYIPFYYFFHKTILGINNAILEGKFFEDTANCRVAKFVLDISGDIICIIGFLIYLEVIELNFCGLNYNFKYNISKRASNEGLILLGLVETESNEETEKEGEDSYVEHSSMEINFK